MKKTISLILLLVMGLSLWSCGGGSKEIVPDELKEVETKEIELTVDNIKDYLAFEFDYSKVERQTKIGISFGYTDITMRSYAVSSGSFNNVEITVEIHLTNGWSVASSDEAYDRTNSEVLTCSFRLPASGEYTDTHDLIAAGVYSNPDSKNVYYTITSVSGKFIES